MATNYRRMSTPDLIAKRSAKRVAEAEYRLAEWEMSAKNVRRLEAFISKDDPKSQAKKAKTAPPAEVVAQAEQVTDATKALAKEMFDWAFAQAPDGKKRLAGKRAYGLVHKGHSADDIKANLDALIA